MSRDPNWLAVVRNCTELRDGLEVWAQAAGAPGLARRRTMAVELLGGTLEPADAQAMNNLGYLLANRGRALDEAVRLVERALVAEPGNPAYLDSLGWAHFRRGDFDEAEKHLLPAAEQLPHNAVVQDHLGDALAGQGRWLDAIAAWTQALEGDGGIDRGVVEQKVQDARGKILR